MLYNITIKSAETQPRSTYSIILFSAWSIRFLCEAYKLRKKFIACMVIPRLKSDMLRTSDPGQQFALAAVSILFPKVAPCRIHCSNLRYQMWVYPCSERCAARSPAKADGRHWALLRPQVTPVEPEALQAMQLLLQRRVTSSRAGPYPDIQSWNSDGVEKNLSSGTSANN